MLEYIEELIRGSGELHVEEERYGDDILVCIDILCLIYNATDEQDATICYTGHEIYDLVYSATFPGDISSMNALEKLEAFSEIHPEFLYARGKTLEEALNKLNDKAFLWNELHNRDGGTRIVSKSQERILVDFIIYNADLKEGVD